MNNNKSNDNKQGVLTTMMKDSDDSNEKLPSSFQEMQLSNKVTSLLEILQKKPKNARIMAQLSTQLMEESKQQQQSSSSSSNKQEEYLRQASIEWANKSIQTAPHKPFGYVALSTVSTSYKTRKHALESLVQLYTNSNNEDDNYEIPHAVALVRLMIEAREEEISTFNDNNHHTTKDKKISKSSIHHPCRKDLSSKEQILYSNITQALDKVYESLSLKEQKNSDNNNSNINKHDIINKRSLVYLCKSEYRLGIFFRRLHHDDPENATTTATDNNIINVLTTHRPKSRRHFMGVLKIYQTIHSNNHNNNIINIQGNKEVNHDNDDEAAVTISTLAQKSQFWLATFETDMLQQQLQEQQSETQNNNNKNNEHHDSNRSTSSSFSTNSIPQIDCCPEDYIKSLYSSFAPKFDDLLVKKLQYQTPTLLRKLVDTTTLNITTNTKNNDNSMKRKECCFEYCIDLGCGTGLSGLAFSDCAKYMIGTDLSPDMIEIARTKKDVTTTTKDCYNDFYVVNVDDALSLVMTKTEKKKEKEMTNDDQCQQPGQQEQEKHDDDTASKIVDLVIACDVFVYVGNLQPVFESVYKHLVRKRGRFAFSTERLEEEDKDDNHQKVQQKNRGYILQPTARFAHKQSYIENLAKKVGFCIEAIKVCPIRKNGGKDINGILVVLSVPL